MVAEIDAPGRTATPSAACRGRRLRPAAGPGQPRALGPPARRAAGRRAHGHPGDQGRGGRRRLRDRPAPRLGRPRRDRARVDGPRAAADRPGRRHRGRHDHRRGAAGPGGHEADLHGAPRAARPSTPPPASAAVAINQRCDVCAVPAAAASSRRRWWRWCSPTPCWRSSAATRSRRPGATRRRTSTRLRYPMSGPLLVLVGPPASGKTTVGTAVAAAAGRRRSATPTPTSRPPPARTVADIFVEHGEAHFRELEARGGRRRAGRARRGAGPRRRSRDRRGHPRAAGRLRPRRRHRGVPRRRPAVGRQAGRPVPRPAAAARQPAGELRTMLDERRRSTREVATHDRRRPAAGRPTRSSPRCSPRSPPRAAAT